MFELKIGKKRLAFTAKADSNDENPCCARLLYQVKVLMPAIGTLAFCMASLGVGYFLGSRARTVAVDATTHHKTLDGDDDASDTYDGDLSAVEGSGPCKLVLVVRTDLNMSAGKIAAQ